MGGQRGPAGRRPSDNGDVNRVDGAERDRERVDTSEEGEVCTSFSRQVSRCQTSGRGDGTREARVADSHSGGFTPEFSKPRLVGFVPVLPVGPVVVDRGQEVLNLLECSLELFLAGGLYEDVEGSVGSIVSAHAS